MDGFAGCVGNSLREECPGVGMGIEMICDDLGGREWWKDKRATISLAQALVKWKELGAIIVPLSLRSAHSSLEKRGLTGIPSSASHTSKDLKLARARSTHTLAVLSDYSALLPLYSTVKGDRSIVHLSGCFLEDIPLNDQPSTTAIEKRWKDTMWDFSFPPSLPPPMVRLLLSPLLSERDFDQAL
jgi:hypothetical protein